MSVDQQLRRPGGQHDVAHVLPERIACDVGDDHLPLQIDGCGARAVARRDLRSLSIARAYSAGRRGPAQRFRRMPVSSSRRIAHTESGATRSITSVIASSVMRRSTLAARRSNTRRSPAVSSSVRLRSVMSVMLPRISRCVARLQPHPAHFAGNVVAERVAEHPFEHRRSRRQRALELRAIRVGRRRAVGLRAAGSARRDCSSSSTVAIHLEEAHRVLVDVDEPVLIEIDDDDDLGRVLDQRAIARLAVAQRRVGRLAIGRVAQAHDDTACADSAASC